MGDRRCTYRVLVGKPEGKRPLGRSKCRWERNIKIDIQEVGRDVDWIGLDMVFPRRDCEVGNPKCIKFCNSNISPVRF
jgi:hypothetical protein